MRFETYGIVCATTLAGIDVVGNSVVVVDVVVVVNAVVNGFGVVVVVVEVVVLLAVLDSDKIFDADALSEWKSVWKFNSDGCAAAFDDGNNDDGFSVDENDGVVAYTFCATIGGDGKYSFGQFVNGL